MVAKTLRLPDAKASPTTGSILALDLDLGTSMGWALCLDTEATFDALEIEQPVEQSCCKVKNGAELLLCPLFHDCGYQHQKPLSEAAQVIVCAHDSLFHIKPPAIGEVGLLVIDEAFWQSGLRGLDGKATLTQDGLEPGRTSLTCYNGKGKMDVSATADLIAARERLCKALRVTEPGSTSGPGNAIALAGSSICWLWGRSLPSTHCGRPACRRGSRRRISTR